jgi:uncharacterized Zn finger protein
LIFRLRGLDRDELVTLLDRAGLTAPVPPVPPAGDPKATPEPLPTGPAEFWQGSELPEGWLGEVDVPPVTAALLGRLGQFPFWRGRRPLIEALVPLYRDASALGLDVFLCETAPVAERRKA